MRQTQIWPALRSSPFSLTRANPWGKGFACLTMSSLAVVCSGCLSPLAPERSMRRASRLLLTLGLALLASTSLALAKDSVTIGMVLEPPGLDPTSAPAAAIGEVTHYNIFEGLTKINEDFSVTPLLAEKWSFSPDLTTLNFTLRSNVKFQDGEPFSSKDVKYSFERYAGKESTNKDKAFFAS